MVEGKIPVYTIAGSTDPADCGDVPTDSNETWDVAVMNVAADGYRLPTDAEWMWAAMGATSGHDYPGSGVYTTGYLKGLAGSIGSNSIDDYAWHRVNAYDVGFSHTNYRITPVGTKLPNELGLYDMSGNVWEWMWDWQSVYPVGELTDPTGPALARARPVERRQAAGRQAGRQTSAHPSRAKRRSSARQARRGAVHTTVIPTTLPAPLLRPPTATG